MNGHGQLPVVRQMATYTNHKHHFVLLVMHRNLRASIYTETTFYSLLLYLDCYESILASRHEHKPYSLLVGHLSTLLLLKNKISPLQPYRLHKSFS